MVCGYVRGDGDISVYKQDLGARYGLPEGTMMLNVRHCNDIESCIRGAKTWQRYNRE
jgi:hypothetical protein